MKLVMFDMDGTLTDAFAIEQNCYVLAIEQALNLPGVKTEWDTYPHTTASFCLEGIARRAGAHGRPHGGHHPAHRPAHARDPRRRRLHARAATAGLRRRHRLGGLG